MGSRGKKVRGSRERSARAARAGRRSCAMDGFRTGTLACSSLSSHLPTPSSPTAPLSPTKFRGAQPSGPAGQQVGSGASGPARAGPRLPPAALHRGPAGKGRSFLPPPCWPRHRVTSPRRVAARTRMCAWAAGLPLPAPPPLRRERAGAARARHHTPLRPLAAPARPDGRGEAGGRARSRECAVPQPPSLGNARGAGPGGNPAVPARGPQRSPPGTQDAGEKYLRFYRSVTSEVLLPEKRCCPDATAT